MRTTVKSFAASLAIAACLAGPGIASASAAPKGGSGGPTAMPAHCWISNGREYCSTDA